jgi:hypothetical protein
MEDTPIAATPGIAAITSIAKIAKGRMRVMA